MADTGKQKAGLLAGLGSESLVPLAFVSVVVLMVLPIPTALLDLFLALNIALSLIILLLAMYTHKPLEFSTFPSVLLVTTLFRLSLNVASTRLILGHGAEGAGAAGEVIEAFGNFVVGGSYAVGLVIFLILVLINFIVITKGAGRIAEVAARFTLDAMPGKQLAIDAELNSGLLSESEARERRRQVEAEADFYGAMDGASKFVRGDAIAGLMIAGINIVGGLVIGILQGGLGFVEAAETYTTLTIGDGLVSQVPSLLISTAAGIIVTRAASGRDLGSEVTGQIFVNPRVLATVAGLLVGFSLVPGLPMFPFLLLSGAAGGLAWTANARELPAADPVAAENAPEARTGQTPAPGAPPPVLDLLELEVGYELVPLVDAGQGGELLERIRNLRVQLGQELGIGVPAVHIRDNLQLKPGEYTVLLKGVELARYEIRMGYLLAIGPSGTDPGLAGVPTHEPAFELDALWIPEADRERAQLAGHTVVDAATVIVTHLTEIVRRHGWELLGRQEVQGLLDGLARTHPKVVEELVPQNLTLGGVQKVLQALLRENVSVRDLLTIVETLADRAPGEKQAEPLAEAVRASLSRQIVHSLLGPDRELALVTMAPELERLAVESLHRSEDGSWLALEPGLAEKILEELARHGAAFARDGLSPVLLAAAPIRASMRRFLERFLPNFSVLSPAEIPAQVRIRALGVVRVGAGELPGAPAAPGLAAPGGAA